ncbi:prostaglandin E receptor 1c (subtype EP1)-like [Arapaima gigas]
MASSAPPPPPEPSPGSLTSAPPTMGMSCVTMMLGTLSNLAALVILAKSRAQIRRRTCTPFLLLTGALLLTDLAGHIIAGTLVLCLHVRGQEVPPGPICQFLGACMVFFGLSPLLLGGAMAAERWMGITRPLLHSVAMTTACACITITVLYGATLLLAVLPLVAVGHYAPQFPGTWCFLPMEGPLSAADSALLVAFSGLGLLALALSLLCNTTSGLALALRAQRGSRTCRPHSCPSSSSSLSLDREMMAQLAGVTAVSCICWCPLLIFILVSVVQRCQLHTHPAPRFEHLLLLALRLASWNQVLDPWVYILLRRTVLRRLCRLLRVDRLSSMQSSSSGAPHQH